MAAADTEAIRKCAMTLYKKTVMNGVVLEEYPFAREFELEGCLASNPELLSLDDDELVPIRVIALEAHLRNGRERSKKRDGRPDMLIALSNGKIGVVELKKDVLNLDALKQLKDYLAATKELSENADLKAYAKLEGSEEIDLQSPETYIGILVGASIDSDVQTEIVENNQSIFAVKLNRFRTVSNDILITSVVYGSKTSRDYCKYTIDGTGKLYGKGRLVLEVIRRYVVEHPEVTFDGLEKAFPASLRGVKSKGWGCFASLSDAKRIAEKTQFKRHFLETSEAIRLKEGAIAVSTQWGIGNIDKFINNARRLGFNIKKKRDCWRLKKTSRAQI